MPPGQSQHQGSDGQRHVLIVDDDVMTLGSLKLAFSVEEGFAVEFAMNASEALLKLKGRAFHAIVADFNLVGPNGDWLLRKVRDKYPSTRRVLLSGQEYPDISRHLDPGLADVFISKPVELDELLEALG